MRKIFCTMSHERGEKVFVGGKLYVIGADGFVEVDDEHAPLLLANTAKWADPSAPRAAFKRPVGPPALILEDAAGHELSEEAAAKAVQAAQAAQPVESAADAAAVEPPADEPLEPEPAPQDWPAVSTESSRRELLANLVKLQAAGFVKADGFHDKMNKMDLLEVTERAYDSMS